MKMGYREHPETQSNKNDNEMHSAWLSAVLALAWKVTGSVGPFKLPLKGLSEFFCHQNT